MIKQTKLKDDELNEIHELQKQFQINTYQIGELSIIKHSLEKQLASINSELADFYSTNTKLQDKEKDIVDKLQSSYPDAVINFETGELS